LSYIGRKPTVGNFQICDAISVVNGQAAYTMQVGSVNVIPQSANHMIVSLNGTIQKPNSSFTVSGSTITFSSNLATGDVIDFIQILGDVLDLGVPSDATVTTAKLASDAVTTAKIADSNITSAKIAGGVLKPPHRNIIINGDMSQAQRGTSFTGLGNGDSAYTLDRFKWSEEGSMTNEWTVSQSTTVPSGQGFAKSFKIDCTTADTSIDSGNIQYVGTAIEGQNLQYLKYATSSAENMVLSFWVRSNKTGTYGVALINNESTEKLYSQTYTISSADTWEKKTLSFVGDTSNNFDNDNGNSLLIQWYLVAGSDKTSGSSQTWGSNTQANRAAGQTVNLADSTSNEWYITGVQLEAGTTASDFEFLPVDVNLARCQRYFELLIGSRSQYSRYSSVTYVNPFFFKVTKRANPTISKTEATFTMFYNNGYDTGVTWNSDIMSVDQVTIYMSSTRDYGFIGPDETKPFKADSEL
jgi:hypothetical protein